MTSAPFGVLSVLKEQESVTLYQYLINLQVFSAILSRSPSSDGVAVLLDTMSRLVCVSSAATSALDGGNKTLLSAYSAEGHLRLVEVLLVPLSGETVMALWTSLDAVSMLCLEIKRLFCRLYHT